MTNKLAPETEVAAATHTSEPTSALDGLDDLEAPSPFTGIRLASLVMFVSNLENSVAFYCKLLRAHVAVIDNTAALLVLADRNQIYLRDVGPRGAHLLGGLGVQYMFWSAGTREEFLRCQEELRRLSPRAALTEHDGFEMIEGRDPDDMPVLISYPGPDQVPRREIISRIYEW